MILADLTWPRLTRVPRESIVVVPLASLEQHSTHLPFSTDAQILNTLVAELEKAASDLILALPTQWLAYAHRHLPYKGTLSMSSDAYVEAVTGTVSSIAGAGFRRFLLLNGQSDNEPLVGVILRRLRERHAGISAVAVSYWTLQDLDVEHEHAGDLETSLMLHLRPDLVDEAEISRDQIFSPSKFASKVLQYSRLDQCSHHGGIGNPETASAEKGKVLYEQIFQALLALVHDFRDGILTN